MLLWYLAMMLAHVIFVAWMRSLSHSMCLIHIKTCKEVGHKKTLNPSSCFLHGAPIQTPCVSPKRYKTLTSNVAQVGCATMPWHKQDLDEFLKKQERKQNQNALCSYCEPETGPSLEVFGRKTKDFGPDFSILYFGHADHHDEFVPGHLGSPLPFPSIFHLLMC